MNSLSKLVGSKELLLKTPVFTISGPSPSPSGSHFSWYGRLCCGFAYGEPSADEAVLCAEAPDADDMFDGGFSKVCEVEGEGGPDGL